MFETSIFKEHFFPIFYVSANIEMNLPFSALWHGSLHMLIWQTLDLLLAPHKIHIKTHQADFI